MKTGEIDTTLLFQSLDKATDEFYKLVSMVDETKFNKVPFEDGWSVAQVATHVKKSNKAIAQGLQMDGTPSNRNSEERIDELKKIFLDFSAKYQSPEFIIPENKIYQKDIVLGQLQHSIEELKRLRNHTNLDEIISLPAFGEITKLEILHFVLYHTQRHIHQLKNINSIKIN